jgi:hypothetical protein
MTVYRDTCPKCGKKFKGTDSMKLIEEYNQHLKDCKGDLNLNVGSVR